MGVSWSKKANSSSSEASTSTAAKISTKTCTGVGNLIKLLPTGTVFLFNFLSPILTNNGQCGQTLNKVLQATLISLCAFSCCFASFTDSYVSSSTGATRYGVVTVGGLWPEPESGEDLSKYRLKVGDFVHAFFALLVFSVLSLLDSNTVRCFYPEFESGQKILLQALPPIIGAVSGTVFMVFPNNRHGIGQTPATS